VQQLPLLAQQVSCSAPQRPGDTCTLAAAL
jgi:hypothetical protein